MQIGAINFHDLSHSKFKDGLFERANSWSIIYGNLNFASK